MPHIVEKLDLFFKPITSIKLNRREIIYLCGGASHSYGLFWQTLNKNYEIELIAGIQQDPHHKSYWQNIINTWDEIKNEIEGIRWYGSKFGLLNFTDEFRNIVFA